VDLHLRAGPSARSLAVGLAGVAAAVLAAWPAAGAAAASPRREPPQAAGRVRAVSHAGWAAYLNGPAHSSYGAAETVIRPGNAASLVRRWHFAPGRLYRSSPTVAGGAVFIGSESGYFYKLSAATGAVQHQVFLGYQRAKTCPGRGFIGTATVAADPVTHQGTVYIGAPDGYLYALGAASLAVRWKSAIAVPSRRSSDYFVWSSPTVAHGKIYIGVASNCDNPLVRGGLIGYSQATGRRLAEFRTIPGHSVGGSIWSSAAVGPDGDVYVSTGNGPPAAPRLGYSETITKLGPARLRPLGAFHVPQAQVTFDGDFGGSPVIFGRYVGACDKNGIFYALRRATMTLAWEQRIGAPSGAASYSQCSGTPVWNGRHLFFGGPAVTIGGTTYRGSVQERDPADGRLVWQTGLPNGVIGSPAMDGGGVIAVGTYDSSSTPNATYLVSAATGRIIRRLVRGTDFAQTVFAGGWLFTANSNGVSGWSPRHRHG
jgi:outer membrane protein assembly factor BamB